MFKRRALNFKELDILGPDKRYHVCVFHSLMISVPIISNLMKKALNEDRFVCNRLKTVAHLQRDCHKHKMVFNWFT